MVVSEIIERLSPNIAPETTAPVQRATLSPVCSLIPKAIGARAITVPTDVPMDMEIKHPIIKRPITAKLGGRKERPRLTVLFTPPDALTAPEKAPAARKIRHIVIMFSSATPFAITFSLSLNFNFLFCRKATNKAIKNATMAGIE